MISYRIVDLKRQNRLKLEQNPKLKVKMQLVYQMMMSGKDFYRPTCHCLDTVPV